MSESANVTSLEGMQEFRVALCAFGDDAKEALVTVDMEAQRAVNWLHDQLKFWQATVTKCEHKLAEAKIVLNRKKISRIFGHKPDTTQEEEDVRKAVGRLKEAEHKVERCRRWGPQLTHAIGEYAGPARQLGTVLEVDLPRTVATLDRMIEALDAYVKLAVPAAPSSATVTSSNEMTSAATHGEPMASSPVAPPGSAGGREGPSMGEPQAAQERRS
jgi:hypothetical protein